MAALGTCVCVGASTEQIPNKNIFIKTVLVKSSHIESMFFNSAQDSMSFTIIHGKVENVVRRNSTSKLQIEFNIS